MNVRPQTLDLGIYLSVFKLFNSFRLSGHSAKKSDKFNIFQNYTI